VPDFRHYTGLELLYSQQCIKTSLHRFCPNGPELLSRRSRMSAHIDLWLANREAKQPPHKKTTHGDTLWSVVFLDTD
jgi:hypothetical protein